MNNIVTLAVNDSNFAEDVGGCQWRDRQPGRGSPLRHLEAATPNTPGPPTVLQCCLQMFRSKSTVWTFPSESPIFPVLGELQPAGHRADVPPAGGPRPRPLPGLLLGPTRSDHPEDVGLFKGTPR